VTRSPNKHTDDVATRQDDGDENYPPSDIVVVRNLPSDTTNADLKYVWCCV
jgi:hypothetical protein